MLVLALTLTNCSTTTGIGSSKSVGKADDVTQVETRGVELAVCSKGVWDPIIWDPAWSYEAVLAIKQNNAARKGWGCPK
jgi:hypothetical protein